LTEIPAALTGKNAALAKALEAAEKAIAALAAADATCAADLRDEVLADGFAEAAADPEDAKRAIQAAESALAARREALEESSRLRTEAARLAREVCEVHEAAAASEIEALDASAGVAVRVATLRMKATKRAAAAMATAAAAEAAGANKSRPGLDPPPQTAVAPDAPDAREVAPEEEYVPEPADGEEEYVPEDVPEASAAPDLEQLLAAGARDPEVLSQALAALPADQRETFEAQLKAAGVM
jgi:regulator of Ty1 transposition protein 103